jgi:glycosyltransferase involved in cell wall biosynthesis
LHGHRYRILHAHCLSPFTLGAIIGGKLWRRRVLLKICAIGRGGDIAKVKRQLLGRMLWRVFLKSDIFIAVTPTVAEEMLFHNVPTHKIVVIPNAVAPDLTEMPDRATRSRARAALGLHDDPIVLFVGWLLHQKGLDVLVRAWAEVVQTHRAKLVLVGGGPETERIRSWIQASGCSDSVRMFGWRSDPETFYRASDIFAFPSRSESFGNALAEAMAHGLAVVTTPVGLARHWIRDGENGILVPGDEPGLLALALRRLIEDGPLRERLGRQARADALTIFSTEAAVESFVNLYRRLDGSSVTTPC